MLDPNVLIAAILSREGTPSSLLRSWLDGGFELVVSDLLLDELERALAYPKLAARVAPADASAYTALLRARVVRAVDPGVAEARSEDPDDDYLLALAEGTSSYLVTGDRHLLVLSDRLPVLTAVAFAALVSER